MVKSVLYTCRDVTRDPAEGEHFSIVGVHVSTASHASMTTGAKQILTHLAVQYLGTETSPLYLLHWYPREHQVDLSFGDVGSERQVGELLSSAETGGIMGFLRSCAASFGERTLDGTLQCSVADIEYDSIAELEEGKHTVALGLNVTMDVTKQQELNTFLSLCKRQ
jgi:hypothetical protein